MICGRQGLENRNTNTNTKTTTYNDKYKNNRQPMMLYVFGKEMTKEV